MRLFISYAHNDKKIVEQLASDLKKLGHDGWFDEELAGSEKWWQRILDEIEACEVFIYAVSPDAIDSPACRTEYQYASDLNKPTLPVMLKDADLIGGLREIQFVDARKLNSRDTALALGRSLSHIQREILEGTHDAPSELPPRPKFPFPEDPLTEFRARIHHLRDVPETELLMMVYELKQLGRSGARTAREVRELLQQMYRSPHISRGVLAEIQDALKALPESKRPNRVLQLLGLLIVAVIVLGGVYYMFLRDEEKPTPTPTDVSQASDTPTLTNNEITATVVIMSATQAETLAANVPPTPTNTAAPTATPTSLTGAQITATVVVLGATQTMSVIQTSAAAPITSVTSADITESDELFFCEAIITNADTSDGRSAILSRVTMGGDAWDTFIEEQIIQVVAQDADDQGAIWYLSRWIAGDLAWVSGWIRGDLVFIYGNCQPPRYADALFDDLLPSLDFACLLTIFDQPEANVYADANEDIFLLKVPPQASYAEAVARVPGPNNRFWYNIRARMGNASVQGWLPATAVQVEEGCEVPDLQE